MKVYSGGSSSLLLYCLLFPSTTLIVHSCFLLSPSQHLPFSASHTSSSTSFLTLPGSPCPGKLWLDCTVLAIRPQLHNRDPIRTFTQYLTFPCFLLVVPISYPASFSHSCLPIKLPFVCFLSSGV